MFIHKIISTRSGFDWQSPFFLTPEIIKPFGEWCIDVVDYAEFLDLLGRYALDTKQKRLVIHIADAMSVGKTESHLKLAKLLDIDLPSSGVGQRPDNLRLGWIGIKHHYEGSKQKDSLHIYLYGGADQSIVSDPNSFGWDTSPSYHRPAAEKLEKLFPFKNHKICSVHIFNQEPPLD